MKAPPGKAQQGAGSSAGVGDAELGLLFAACLSDDGGLRVPAEPFDWGHLRELARRHRVEGLLWHSLSRSGDLAVPRPIVDELAAVVQAQSLKYLAQLAETLRLSELLAAQGIASIAMKGCILAGQLYPHRPALRQSNDIDLLVDPSRFAAADAALSAQGYVRETPAAGMPHSADSMARYLTNAYEFYHPTRGLKVELHHRLLLDPNLMPVPFADLFARAVPVSAGGTTVHRLAPDDLAIYLSCHGAEDAFFRIKWLVDIARLAKEWSAADVEALCSRARVVGGERHLRVALVMLERWGCDGVPLRGPETDGALARLADAAEAAIRQPDRGGERMRLADVPADLRMLAYGVRLSQDWRSRWFKVLRYLTNHQDMSTLKLGAAWWLVYAAVGRPLALWRWLKRSSISRTSPK